MPTVLLISLNDQVLNTHTGYGNTLGSILPMRTRTLKEGRSPLALACSDFEV
jgi:hypothetical protein